MINDNDNPFDPAPQPTPAEEAELLAEHAERVARRWEARPSIPAPGLLGASLGESIAAIAARTATPEHAEAVALDRARQARMARRAVAAIATQRGLPAQEELRAVATNPNPVLTPALEAVRNIAAWRGARRRGVVRVLAGPPGTGKTCAAAWTCLWDAPDHPREVSALFVAAAEIGRTPRNNYSEHLAAWRRWTEMPLLVIDDLGLEGEAAREGLALLLLERYDAGRVTICTANLPDAAVGARYLAGEIGPRLADRLLRGQSLPWYVAVDGTSLRGAA
jgi:DNA replication protein DnaC